MTSLSAALAAKSQIWDTGLQVITASRVKQLTSLTQRKDMSESVKTGITPKASYTAISIALLLPVLAWPLQSLLDGGLSPGAAYHSLWLTSATALLLCAVTADSILLYRPNSLWPFFTSAWILLISMSATTAIRFEESGALILALLFALHALRSALPLWRDDKDWWLWAAWGRDTVSALSIFTWLLVLAMERG